MNAAMIWGITRTLLASASGYVVAKGYMDAETYASVSGAIGVIFVAVWSALAKKPAA